MEIAEKKGTKVIPERPETMEHFFSREQLLSSKRFQERRDLINVLLDSEGQYTIEAVEQKIANYMKGKVN